MLTEKHSSNTLSFFCGSNEYMLSLRLLMALPPVFIVLALVRWHTLHSTHSSCSTHRSHQWVCLKLHLFVLACTQQHTVHVICWVRQKVLHGAQAMCWTMRSLQVVLAMSRPSGSDAMTIAPPAPMVTSPSWNTAVRMTMLRSKVSLKPRKPMHPE